jgi:hypothetical protein
MKYINTLLVPGVIIHEISHVIMCYLMKCQVVEVCYFRSIFDASGFVKHVKSTKLLNTSLIGISPIFLTPLSLILFIIANITLNNNILISFILYWLAIVIAIGSVPSSADINTIYDCINDIASTDKSIVVYLPYVQFADVITSFSRNHLNLIYVYFIYLISLIIIV